MGIAEKIYREINNRNSIFLYKEGMFWRAYERSAYNFVGNVRKYKVLKKYIKLVKQEVCFLGFPDNIFDALLTKHKERYTVKAKSNDYCELVLIPDDNNHFVDFEQWKNAIAPLRHNDYNIIITKLKEIDISVKTPMECMQFLYELKIRLDMIEEQTALNQTHNR